MIYHVMKIICTEKLLRFHHVAVYKKTFHLRSIKINYMAKERAFCWKAYQFEQTTKVYVKAINAMYIFKKYMDFRGNAFTVQGQVTYILYLEKKVHRKNFRTSLKTTKSAKVQPKETFPFYGI